MRGVGLRGGQGDRQGAARGDRGGFLVGIDGDDVRDRGARAGFAHDFEFALAVAGNAQEAVLLVGGGLVEEAHPVVGVPAEQKVLIDKDFRARVGRLLEGGAENRGVRIGCVEILLPDGAGHRHQGGHPEDKGQVLHAILLFTSQCPDRPHRRWVRDWIPGMNTPASFRQPARTERHTYRARQRFPSFSYAKVLCVHFA